MTLMQVNMEHYLIKHVRTREVPRSFIKNIYVWEECDQSFQFIFEYKRNKQIVFVAYLSNKKKTTSYGNFNCKLQLFTPNT
jgi:hypothetical protein